MHQVGKQLKIPFLASVSSPSWEKPTLRSSRARGLLISHQANNHFKGLYPQILISMIPSSSLNWSKIYYLFEKFKTKNLIKL